MNKEDYHKYLNCDAERSPYYYSHEMERICNPYLIDKEIWKFQKTLRKCEFLYTNDGGVFHHLKKLLYAYKLKRLSIKLGFTIPCFCFGPGLKILHRGTIVVNANARIGKNCTINAGVNIGTKAGYEGKCPIIGDNVYIGPGAKLFGDIEIADRCAIGANAVVTKSFTAPNSIIAGVPAKVIGKVERNLL